MVVPVVLGKVASVTVHIERAAVVIEGLLAGSFARLFSLGVQGLVVAAEVSALNSRQPLAVGNGSSCGESPISCNNFA